MGNGCDDYIRTFGQAIMVNTFLKFTTAILGVTSLVLAGMVMLLLGKVREVNPLPIYIDKATGAAKPVDFRSVDAAGDRRIDVEIIDFCNTYVTCLYTFNRYTIKSNLDSVFAQSVKEVTERIQYYLNEADRPRYVRSNAQGVCQVEYTDIVSIQPDIKVQVAFRRQIVGENKRENPETMVVAVMRLKPVTRTVKNSHGLMVVEYRESPMREVSDEKTQ